MKQLALTLLACICFNILSAQHGAGLLFTKAELYRVTGLSCPIFYGDKLPAKVDLSANLPPPGDQALQQSCVAWALAYACRSYYRLKQLNIKSGSSLTSNEWSDHTASPAFIYNLLNNGENQPISYARALRLLMDTGACSDHRMPYDKLNWTKKPDKGQLEEAKNFRIDTFKRINLDYAIENLKGELVSGNPVICAFAYYEHYFNFGHGTTEKFYLLDSLEKPAVDFGHAVVLVGFDDSLGAFKFMNSWGVDWGNKGFGWISYKLVPEVIKEAFIIKPKALTAAYLQAAVARGDTTLHQDEARQNVYTAGQYKKLARAQVEFLRKPSLGVYIDNLHELTDATGTTAKQLNFSGFTNIKDMNITKYEVVIRFFMSNNGQKGDPIRSKDQRYKLANGQVAAKADVNLLQFEAVTLDQWSATIPVSAFDFPAGKVAGNGYRLPITTKIIAEPVLFGNDFPLVTGPDFEVKINY